MKRRAEPAVKSENHQYYEQCVPSARTPYAYALLSPVQLETLSLAIVEVGGTYWERILDMHGTHGQYSHVLAYLQPWQLWRAACDMYCRHMESGQTELPYWLQLVSKSISMDAQSSLREREIVQAAYDAYDWQPMEDHAIIDALGLLRAPKWRDVYEVFLSRCGGRRTQAEIEKRAIVLHSYYSFFKPLSIPEGLNYVRTEQLNSFGLPWNIDWTEQEDAKLLEGIDKIRAPCWGKILAMYGKNGSCGNALAAKSEPNLANRAREWWSAASGPSRVHISESVLEVLQFVQPKGMTGSGMPTSRGWSDELDKLLISELLRLQSPNYNEILLMHGVNGQISTKFATKNYAQLRSRALKLYDFCIKEGKVMPNGLQYAKRT